MHNTIVVIDGESLTLDEFYQVAIEGKKIQLHPSIPRKILPSRLFVEKIVRENKAVYGVTTGFGKFKDTIIPLSDVKLLQKNLLLSHACGIGEPFPVEVVRGMLLLRINNLARGFSGIRYVILELLLELLNKDVCPIVPGRGSVGASGDLAPLAHLALSLIGEGEVLFDGKVKNSKEILSFLGLSPIELESKEGLALINGTQAMTSCAAISLIRARNLLVVSDIAGCMTLETLMGSQAAFDEKLQKVRPHAGQIATAKNLKRLLEGSILMESHRDCGRVQDAYSLRCMPQVHGAVKDAVRDVTKIIMIEINSVTDNPLIFPDDNGDMEEIANDCDEQILSGGNFHGHPVSLYCDLLRAALTSLANISERRTDRLLNPATSGLPPFLIKEGGVNSGFMIPQYVQASLVSECKVLSSPCSVDSIPTSAYQEDYVSMGTTSARLALQVVEHVERVIAIELLVAAQALEFRRPLAFGKGTEAALKVIRKNIPFLEKDRYLKPDLDAAWKLLRDGTIKEAVENAVGELSC